MKHIRLTSEPKKTVGMGRNTFRNTFLLLILTLFAYVTTAIIHFKIARLFMKYSVKKEEDTFTSRAITFGKESPPLIMGPQRLHYIYATALPQAYLTLLSVLQGIVFGVLLLKIPFPKDLSLVFVLSFFLQQHAYLPYVVSSLVILIVWNQYLHGILFLAWPFNVFQSSLIFLTTIAEIIAFTNIDVFSTWLFGLGLIAVVGALVRFNNIRYLPGKKLSAITPVNDYAAFSKKTEITDGTLYIILGAIIVAFSSIYNYILAVVAKYNILFPFLLTWFVIAILFCMVCTILVIDKINRVTYLNTFVKESDLIFSPHGIISYKKEGDKEV